MLMCSFVHFYFVGEHLFTFQFCALMPKIFKENVADIMNETGKEVGKKRHEKQECKISHLKTKPFQRKALYKEISLRMCSK